ncbi:MAG: TolC family protein [Rhodothermales bacterium]
MNASSLRRIGTLLALLLFVSVSVQAQDVRRISFNEAIQIALDQNISLKQSANQVEITSTRVSDNKWSFYPNLNLSTGAGQSYGRNIDLTTNDFVNEAAESWNASVSTGVSLYTGGRRQAALAQSRLDLEAADFQYDRQRQTVIFRVMSNYLNLIDQSQQVLIREENLAAQQQELDRIQEFVRVGQRAISDQFQQETQVANAELQLIQTQRLLQLAEANLIQILQLDPFGAYEFVIPNLDANDLEEQAYNVSDMLNEAFAQRTDLQAQERSIEASEKDIQIARAGRLPSINLSGSYNTRWSSVAADRLNLADQLDLNRGGGVSVGLSLPLFDRFNTRNNTQRARVQYQNALLGLENLRQDVALEVRQAYLDYQTAIQTLDATAAALAAAEQALEVEQERYAVGSSTIVELTQSRASFVQAQSNRASAVYDFLFREKLIEYYTGGITADEALFD